MYSRDQRFISDRKIIADILKLIALKGLRAPYCDVFTGKGAILSALPHPRGGIERDTRFREHLLTEDVLWEDLGRLTITLPARTVTANPPFSNIVRHLRDIHRTFPLMEGLIVILQDDIAKKLKGANKLGFMIRELYNSEVINTYGGECFEPAVRVKTSLLYLTRRSGNFFEVLEKFVRPIHPRKKLSRYGVPGALGQKRIDELTVTEQNLLKDYLIQKFKGIIPS